MRPERREPEVTVHWEYRRWSKAEYMELARLLFEPRPEEGEQAPTEEPPSKD